MSNRQTTRRTIGSSNHLTNNTNNTINTINSSSTTRSDGTQTIYVVIDDDDVDNSALNTFTNSYGLNTTNSRSTVRRTVLELADSLNNVGSVAVTSTAHTEATSRGARTITNDCTDDIYNDLADSFTETRDVRTNNFTDYTSISETNFDANNNRTSGRPTNEDTHYIRYAVTDVDTTHTYAQIESEHSNRNNVSVQYRPMPSPSAETIDTEVIGSKNNRPG